MTVGSDRPSSRALPNAKTVAEAMNLKVDMPKLSSSIWQSAVTIAKVRLARESTCLPHGASRFETNQQAGAAKLTLFLVKLRRLLATCRGVTSTKAVRSAFSLKNITLLRTSSAKSRRNM
jgi:hypothetical protein